ncbi:MAG: rhodanese-like domain-containing protein [Thermoanaerobaculia bacterium]
MSLKRHLGEAATLVVAAVLCALVANTLARSERRLPLVGSYPNALKVPEKKTGGEGSSAPSQGVPAVSSPVDSGAQAASEVSSKVDGAAASVPAAPATATASKATPAAAAPGKLPLEEKRPGPRVKSTAAAPEPPKAGEQKDLLLSRFPPHPDKPYVEISGDDVAWLVARGVLVVDARRTKDYESGHVAGARNISPWEGDADAKITALVNEGRDGQLPVVLYCSGGECEDSHMLAQRLFGGGLNNLLVYRDGWPDWVRRRGPSAAGPEPSP